MWKELRILQRLRLVTGHLALTELCANPTISQTVSQTVLLLCTRKCKKFQRSHEGRTRRLALSILKHFDPDFGEGSIQHTFTQHSLQNNQRPRGLLSILDAVSCRGLFGRLDSAAQRIDMKVNF